MRRAGIGGIIAFYSLIHVRRRELTTVLSGFYRVLRPRGRALMSVHEGVGEEEVDAFLGVPVPFAATLFTLDQLVGGEAGCWL